MGHNLFSHILGPKSPDYCGFDPWNIWNATILPGGRISFPTGQTRKPWMGTWYFNL